MKIVCDACQAKYSISDDKVQGKVFKIRCKKCSNIIVVRGGGNASADAAPEPAPQAKAQEKETRVYDYGYDAGGEQAPAGDDAVWHVVINQDQVGPMTAAEVGQRYAAGEIDADTYIWREGFADWLPVVQVDTFAHLAAAAAPAASGNGGRDAVSAMFGGGGSDDTGTMRSDPGDLFAAASAQSRRAEVDDDGGDLFGGGRGGAASEPAAASGGGGGKGNDKLRGERNENSVLFSLGNLAQLASDKPAPVTSTPSGHATGAAGGEGSGLIDIRSMASAYLGGGAATNKPASTSIGSIDDLPVFSGGGFAEPAVFVPTARPQQNNKILYAMIGAVGLLVIVAVVLVVVMVRGGKSNATVAAADHGPTAGTAPTPVPAIGSAAPTPGPDTAGSAAAAPTGSAAAPVGSAAAPAGSAAQVAVNEHVAPAPTPTPVPTPAHHEVAPAHHEVAPPSHHEVAAAHHEAAPPKGPDKAPDKAPAAGGGDCDEVGCLLNNNEGACCAKFKKGKAKPAGGGGGDGGGGGGGGNSNLPETLDAGMISGGMAAVRGRAMGCGDKSSAKGKVKVHVKVGADGKITSVSVGETPDAALGNCVASAVQRASFPKTQRGGSFGYPFVF